MQTNRRQFLHAVVTSGTGLVLATSASAIEPIQRPGRPYFRLSLAAYSFRKYLDLKIKPKPPMTLDDFAELAAGLNLDAIEPTAYYFADPSPMVMAHLKGKCTRLGLDISGTAVGNNFCHRDPDKQRQQIAHVKEWVEHASRLGAKTVRIFAGKAETGDTEESARTRCVEAIQEACDHAGKYGVYLALENHGGITATVEQTLELVRAVKHDWFGVNLDTGNFRSADPYADLTRLAPYAVTVQLKTEVVRGGKKEDADLARLLAILREASYRGTIALEYEAAEEPKDAVPRHVATLQKLIR